MGDGGSVSETLLMSMRSSPSSGTISPARRPRLSVFLLVCMLALAFPAVPDAQSPNEALFNAVEVNDVDAVEAAISAGADLTAKNAEGMTPADVAVDLGHFRIAHLLLSKRTQPPTAQTAPRVTAKIKEALTQPKQRVTAPGTRTHAAPDPKLADIIPPKKPVPDTTAVIAPPAETSPAPKPMAKPKAAPAPARKAPPPPAMRPDDEIAAAKPETSTPMPADTPTPPAVDEGGSGGFLTNFWDGFKNVITLGGMIGDPRDQHFGSEDPIKRGKNGEILSNPADRFTSRSPAGAPASAPPPESDSSAGRMVDRMTGMVAGEKPAENAFGLPEGPVVPPLEPATPGDMAAPGMVGIEPLPPSDAMPGLAAPDLASPAPDLSVPGLAAPELGTETAELPGSPGDLAVPVLPPDGNSEAIEVPGLAMPELPPGAADTLTGEIPGLAAPQLPDGPAPPDPEGMPGLEIPGLAAPTGEVPGIIPPPSESAGAIPALPPGLEPLPGSNTGELRRPGGLVEPEDPNVLPPPGGENLTSRLKRIDELLNRNPTQNSERYLTPRGTEAETGAPNAYVPRTAPEKPAVTKSDPFLEIPKGLEKPRTAPKARVDDRASPEEILRRARESDAVMREREIHENKPGRNVKNVPRPLRPSGHQLPLPDKPITSRAEPSSRMMARLGNLTGSQYQDEDIHGLPIIRPSIDNTVPPRKDIEVAGIPADVAANADAKLQKLARFFRGDQEEEAGMKAPEFKNENRVEKEPLPRVIDNMLPENDPARSRVVDDKLLDLSGVELRPDPANGQAGATSTRDGQLNPNFLDRLTTVLGPAREQPVPSAEAQDEPGKIGLKQLDVPADQMVKKAKPAIPDPWTMTVERNDPEGQKQTLGVTAISPQDGSEMRTEQGVVSEMVGRIRQLFKGPKDLDKGPQVEKLDDEDRQAAAERLLSDALRDGVPTALPDQGQWPITEVEATNATPGVPPAPRPGVLTRTSLDDVVLSLGESVTLENTLPPQQDGIDPLNSCVKKNRGTTLFCIEPVDWPTDLRPAFVVPTILYTGPSAITRYDQGSPSRFHALFESDKFEQVVAYYQARYGEPTEIWKRSIAPLAKPRMDNPTVTWRSRDSRTNVISVLEIRKFDDSRGGFPDTNRGAVMLYHYNAPSIFPQVSSHELMRLRRASK